MIPLRTVLAILIIPLFSELPAQPLPKADFTRSDSLRGYLNPYRSCYDVIHYDLYVRVDVDQQAIQGHNAVLFRAQSTCSTIQLDLYDNMDIDSINFGGRSCRFTREGHAFFVELGEKVEAGDLKKIEIYYHGKPVVSENPPWDGGFVWEKDSLGRDWVGVACEGAGASLWWPNKDHLSDEPDSMSITLEAPESLMAVSNGQLISKRPAPKEYRQWIWEISYPINNYNVTLNLGHYRSFSEPYISEGDTMALRYYVLDYNLEEAKDHFSQVHGMLRCYEDLLGRFPFWEDGFAMVETPYWGMEHQTCIAYGNQYENNGYGFDFIIIHESGHEYWGNAVTARDHGELWIHESFTTYLEALYVEYFQGKEKAISYLQSQRERIYNIRPILGPLHVNYNDWIDADMYYKGSWMLHSLRHTVGDDQAWFSLLKNTFRHFAYSQIHSEDLIAYMNAHTDYDIEPIFLQFLTTNHIPVLEVSRKITSKGLRIKYRWKNTLRDFNMPVGLRISQEEVMTLYPSRKKQTIYLDSVDPDLPEFTTDLYYFEVEEK